MTAAGDRLRPGGLPRRIAGEVYPFARPVLWTGVVALAWAGWASGPGWLTPAYVVLAIAGAALGVIDARTRRLPNVIVYPLTVALAVLLLAAAAATGAWADLGRAALGGVAYSGLHLVLHLITRGQVGMGDVKLAVPLGAVAAWHGWTCWVVNLYGAYLLGGVVVLVLLVARLRTRRDYLPFGPFLLAGTAVALTWARLAGW